MRFNDDQTDRFLWLYLYRLLGRVRLIERLVILGGCSGWERKGATVVSSDVGSRT